MGLFGTAPCEFINPAVDLGCYVFTAHRTCDGFMVIHIISPFFFAILIKDWLIAFNFAGYNELIEATVLILVGSYVAFLGDSEPSENIAGTYVEDWLIQGGIATFLLAPLFMRLFDSPRLLAWKDSSIWIKRLFSCGTRKKFRKEEIPSKDNNRMFWFYLIAYIIWAIPTIFTEVYIDTFRLGGLILLLWQPIYFISIYFIERRWFLFKWIDRWTSKPRKSNMSEERWKFWFYLGLIMTLFLIQDQFDWLRSSAIQTWVVSGLLIIIMWSIVKYREWNKAPYP